MLCKLALSTSFARRTKVVLANLRQSVSSEYNLGPMASPQQTGYVGIAHGLCDLGESDG
jgi:hypothetical protein